MTPHVFCGFYVLVCRIVVALSGEYPLSIDQLRHRASPEPDPRLLDLATALVLCNSCQYEGNLDSSPSILSEQRNIIGGNATDIGVSLSCIIFQSPKLMSFLYLAFLSALFRFAESFLDPTRVRVSSPEVAKVVFSSQKKWMATVHRQNGQSKPLLLLKGAPERVLEHCTQLLKGFESADQEQVHPLVAETKAQILAMQDTLAGDGARVLGVCRRRLPASFGAPDFVFDTDQINFPVDDMTFVGLV